jgi:hypothetical protein
MAITSKLKAVKADNKAKADKAKADKAKADKAKADKAKEERELRIFEKQRDRDMRSRHLEFANKRKEELREWRQLDPLTRAEHVLSNSVLYRHIRYLEEFEQDNFMFYDPKLSPMWEMIKESKEFKYKIW